MSSSAMAGSALIHMPHNMARNRGQWLSIAAALDKCPSRDLAEHARRVGQAEAARQRQAEQQQQQQQEARA